MKEKIHPKYYTDAKVTCACGNTFTTGSTQKVLRVELCSKCHPFFTGKSRIIDTGGRVERFKQRYKKTEGKKAETPTAESAEKAEK
jgi:large subunit ribosomal protein L31